MDPSLSHSRRQVPYGLPELNSLGNPRTVTVNKASAIAASLREIATKTRNHHLQPFYSMRLVAEHFHVPPAMIARIYHRLSSEGLLRMVWGSKTLLEPF